MSASCARLFSGSIASRARHADVARSVSIDLVGEQDAELLQHRRPSSRRPRTAQPACSHDVGELVPHLLALVELLELGQRLGMIRLGVGDLLATARSRSRASSASPRRAWRPRRTSGLAAPDPRSIDLSLVDADELLPVAALLVVGLEVSDGGRVAAVELEHLLVGLDGLGDVRELLLEEVRDAQVQLDLPTDVTGRWPPSSAARR